MKESEKKKKDRERKHMRAIKFDEDLFMKYKHCQAIKNKDCKAVNMKCLVIKENNLFIVNK